MLHNIRYIIYVDVVLYTICVRLDNLISTTCTVYRVQYSMYIVHIIVYDIQYIVYII